MSELLNTLKSKTNQASEALNQLRIATKGLTIKAKNEGTQAFREWVELGETQLEAEASGADSLVTQAKSTLKAQWSDLNGSAEQLKLASLGLLCKTREEGSKLFQTLVDAAETDKTPTPVEKTTATRRATRKTVKAVKSTSKKPTGNSAKTSTKAAKDTLSNTSKTTASTKEKAAV